MQSFKFVGRIGSASLVKFCLTANLIGENILYNRKNSIVKYT